MHEEMPVDRNINPGKVQNTEAFPIRDIKL